MLAVTFSKGIRAIGNIGALLGVHDVLPPRRAERSGLPIACVVVWGRKQNALKALSYAQKKGIPVWYLEDGWIRSCSESAHSRLSYSILIDRRGVYYDSTQPSQLEQWLNLADDEIVRLMGASALKDAKRCRERLVEHGITKYNYCSEPDISLLRSARPKPLVLIIDQTVDDVSVLLGGMGHAQFCTMLDRAVAENPDARIVVRTHPDVIAGRRRGYLTEYARQQGIEIHAERDNPMVWMREAERVYVGTSQLGYEALLCGCKVSVAGKPFYAGWGLTDDWQVMQRRHTARTIDQLFYATHFLLARYCDPVTGSVISLDACIDHVIEQKRNFRRNAQNHVCQGISPWKRRYLSQYLRSPDGRVRYGSASTTLAADEVSLCWSFRDGGNVGDARVRVEDGFLRSVGLGSDFVAPGSLVIDDQGLYFDPAGPSELENLLNFAFCSDADRLRASQLRQRILDTGVTKYQVGSYDQTAAEYRPESGKKVVLVIGQVEDDESIKRGCLTISNNADLCDAVRQKRPDAYIVYKPHPDVESGNRKGQVPGSVLQHSVDHVEADRSLAACLGACDEVHTLTSLSGFEALMRGIPVFTYGLPFYAGWGLTEDHCYLARRQRRLSLDELVYFSLIVYPRYLDIPTGEFITAEQRVELQNSHRHSQSEQSLPRPLYKLRNILSALLYKP
jgi:capsular polysaccharide export protein